MFVIIISFQTDQMLPDDVTFCDDTDEGVPFHHQLDPRYFVATSGTVHFRNEPPTPSITDMMNGGGTITLNELLCIFRGISNEDELAEFIDCSSSKQLKAVLLSFGQRSSIANINSKTLLTFDIFKLWCCFDQEN
jgi:hypothetical protein